MHFIYFPANRPFLVCFSLSSSNTSALAPLYTLSTHTPMHRNSSSMLLRLWTMPWTLASGKDKTGQDQSNLPTTPQPFCSNPVTLNTLPNPKLHAHTHHHMHRRTQANESPAYAAGPGFQWGGPPVQGNAAKGGPRTNRRDGWKYAWAGLWLDPRSRRLSPLQTLYAGHVADHQASRVHCPCVQCIGQLYWFRDGHAQLARARCFGDAASRAAGAASGRGGLSTAATSGDDEGPARWEWGGRGRGRILGAATGQQSGSGRCGRSSGWTSCGSSGRINRPPIRTTATDTVILKALSQR